MNFAKITLRVLLMLTLAFGFTACDDDDDDPIYIDTTPPSVPQNVKVFTGDGELHITWDHSPEDDVDGYGIWESSDNKNFSRITDVNYDVNYYIDNGLENGVEIFYAVTAFDVNGNETDIETNDARGITRPEGTGVIKDYLRFPELAGFNFGDYMTPESVVPYDVVECEFFYENFEGTYYLNVWHEYELQDMGPTQDIYEIEFAPTSGWIPLLSGENVKYTEAIVGHTYVIWTKDNYYGKIRITELTGETMAFEWAFQLFEGEKMLKRGKRTFDSNIDRKAGVKKLNR